VGVLLDALKDAAKAAQGPQEYWVGSAVPYGPFHEFGTARIVARPHWNPTLSLISEKYRLATNHDELVNAMLEAPRGLTKIIAFDVERGVKQSITVQGIIDTGNYRGSVATGPSEADAFNASAARSTI